MTVRNSLPDNFHWLADLTGPLMIVEAVKEYGTVETPGSLSNPKIIAWAKETGLDAAGYVDDETPWCGLFICLVAMRAHKLPPPVPLRALSWAHFGIKSPEPSLGDVLVFTRSGGGHVALYVGESESAYYCLGGNQNDAVSIAPKSKARLFACRRPIYRQTPDNVRPILIGAAAIASAEKTTKEV